MLLTLYDQDGNEKTTLSPNDTSTQDKEIQGDNVLNLSFTLYEYVSIDVNDYVDFEGERYWAVEKYQPQEKSTVEWGYDIHLYGIESLIKRFLVLNATDDDMEPVFTLTARPIDHVRMIVGCINAGMGTTDWKVGTVVGNDNVTIDYDGKYCDEGLRELAEAVGVEWWIEGETVNLCRCEHGDEIVLAYGNGLTSLERDMADNAKFYTRLFPIGSSRNIDPEKYHHSRLQLPNGAKYVDVNVEKYGVIHHYEKDAFSGIYPRRIGTVSSVRSVDVTDDDGKPYTIYYFKDDGLDFDPNDYELAGLVKHVSFQEGSELAGLGTGDDHYFEVNYDSETREFEIITIWPYDNGTQLPGGTLVPLVPKVSDKYILWNIGMPDEYYRLAEREFQDAVAAYNMEHTLDVSCYKAPTDHVWIEDTGTELSVGRRVKLISDKYFPETGYRKSRITRISRQVTLPSQMDLEIGDALSMRTLDKIDDAINDAKNIIRSFTSSLPDIIRTGDDTRWTDNNLLSALRSMREFLSKTKDDTARGIITFLKGILFGSQQRWKIDGDGNAVLNNINAQKAIFDTLIAQNAHFFNLIIDEVKSVGGQVLITDANCRIDLVEKVGNEFYCYFKATDETRETVNQWDVDDMAIHYEFSVSENGTRNYWRLVTGTSNEIQGDDKTVEKIINGETTKCHYIVLSDVSGNFKAGSADPKAGDDVSQLGNRNSAKTDRQNAIILSAYNIPFIYTGPFEGDANGIQAPLYASFYNINDFVITEDNLMVGIARNGHVFKGRVVIKQGSTLADGREINQLGITEGNLVRNSGFTGNYESEEASENDEVIADTIIFSDPLKFWESSNAVVNSVEDDDYKDKIRKSVSGSSAIIDNGWLKQSIESGISIDTWFVLSFKACCPDITDATLNVSLGGVSNAVVVYNSVQRVDLPFKSGHDASVSEFGTLVFQSSSKVMLMDVMLICGNIPSEYRKSEKDNDKSLANFLGLSYLQRAFTEASTEILGGLILTQLIKVGMYRDKQFTQETGGMSGLYIDEHSPFLYGGGTLEQAIYTAMKYSNPKYQPTDEEVADMAKFVVTHGGRAILNDICLRGYIYALGGIFKNVSSVDGKWSLDENGIMRCVDAWISGSVYTPYTIINNDNITKYATLTQITVHSYFRDYTVEAYVIDIERSGLNIQIDFDTQQAGAYMYIAIQAQEKYNGAELNVFANYNCALVGVSRVSMVSNTYELYNPILYKGQKIKLKCFNDNNTYRWIVDSYSDSMRFRSPLKIAQVEVLLAYISDNWTSFETTASYHASTKFDYSINQDNKIVVTIPSDWQNGAVDLHDMVIVAHSVSYSGIGATQREYASVISYTQNTFTLDIGDAMSGGDKRFGFTIYLDRDAEATDFTQQS